MKLTRRQLVITATAGSMVAAKALAQSVPGAPVVPGTTAVPGATAGPRDFAKESLDGVQHNRETLAKFVIPMSTEPAFQFKA